MVLLKTVGCNVTGGLLYVGLVSLEILYQRLSVQVGRDQYDLVSLVNREALRLTFDI